MCFSATASFATSGILALISVVANRSVHYKSQRMLALVPFLFAIQQASEGILWITVGRQSLSFLHYPAAYGFLFFVFILWPIWIPLTVHTFYHRYKDTTSTVLVLWGFAVGTTLGYFLFTTPFNVIIENHHIVYNFNFDQLYDLLGSAAYLIAVLLPFFLAPTRTAQIFGILLAGSYIISHLFYHYASISIWCFFAAVLSAYTCFMIWQDNREKQRR